MDITLTQLEYIVAVDKHRHFAKAAKTCFVTQPTLSMQIKKLEEQLGAAIFDRNKQPIEPTELGESILEQARLVLRESHKIEAIIQQYTGDVSGTLTLGIIPTVAPYLLPLFIGDFVRQYPNISIHLREMTTENIIKGLKEDSLDIGIAVTPLKDEYIEEEVLYYEDIDLYVNEKHAFYQQDKVSIDTLSANELWLLSEGHCFRSQMLNLCAIARSSSEGKIPFRYESGSLEALKQLVDKEGGYTLLPRLAAVQLLNNKKKQVKTFAGNPPLRAVSLVFVRNYAKRQLTELLTNYIQARIPKEMLKQQNGYVVNWTE